MTPADRASIGRDYLLANPGVKLVHACDGQLAGARGEGPGPFNCTMDRDLRNYVMNVLRFREGEKFILSEYSNKRIYEAVVRYSEKTSSLDLFPLEHSEEAARRYTVFAAAARGRRNDDTVERLTELGTDSIVLFGSERCVAGADDGKVPRLTKVAVAASSQCRRLFPPTVSSGASLDDILSAIIRDDAVCFVMLEPSLSGRAPGTGLPDASAAFARLRAFPQKRVIIVSGPEGGFTPAEADRLSASPATAGNGFTGTIPMTLRGTVLRAEFAPSAALAIIKYESGDYR